MEKPGILMFLLLFVLVAALAAAAYEVWGTQADKKRAAPLGNGSPPPLA